MPLAWSSLTVEQLETLPIGTRIRNTSHNGQEAVDVEGVLASTRNSVERPSQREELVVRGLRRLGGGDPVGGSWIIPVWDGTWYREIQGERPDGLDGRSLRLVEPWYERVQARRRAADAKHGANSIERIDGDDDRWLAILGEEVGEVSDEVLNAALARAFGKVAHAQTYDSTADIEHELVDVIAVAASWLEARRRKRDMDELIRKENPAH